MTLPYIGQRPADNQLTQIAANIRQIANPNWEMQLEMQRRMMADPRLVSELAEVERNAPGTIAKMGFGKKLTDIIVKTPETLAQKETKELRSLQLQDAKNNLEQFTMRKTEFQQSQEDRTKQLAGIEAFKKFNIPKEMESWVAGKPNKEFINALSTAGNENQQIFMAAVSNLQQMRRLEQEHSLAMTRINRQEALAGAREDKAYKRMIDQNAVDSYQKEQVGSVAAWRALIDSGSGGQERLQSLMKNPTLAKSQLDRDLLTIGSHIQSNQNSAREFQKAQLLGKARAAMVVAQSKNLKKEEIPVYVQEINSAYAGVRQIDPTFNRSVRQKGKDIELVDENTGLILKDEAQAVDISRLPTPIDKATNQPVPPRKFLDDLVADWRAAPTFGKDNRSSFAAKVKKQYGKEVFDIFWKRVKD